MPLLDWVNRNQAEETADQVPYHLLKFEESYGDSEQSKDNLIIQGDNLQALKALLPLYGGQVKCIFIDPPYNTQEAFKHYDDKLEHSQWLSMMYPRLQLLKELMSEDGSIWVILDGNEVHYLKAMCDEIFGRSNYLGDLIWKKRKGGGNDSRFFAIDHDHILVYLKNSSKNLHKEKWRTPQLDKYLKRYNLTDENGKRFYWDTLARNGLKNPIPIEIECPDGSILNFNSQKGMDTINKGLKEGSVKFTQGKNGWSMHHKVYMSTKGQVLRSILESVGTNKESGDEMELLFGDKKAFDYPKPERLISTILNLCTSEGDLILDSFLGSGTTAAVAHKMRRKYIGVEMGEQAQTHVIPRLKKVIEGEQGGISINKDYYDLKSDLLKDLDLDIDEVKTFNKVLQKINKETDLLDKDVVKTIKNATRTVKVKSESVWHGGGGFSFYTLGSTVFDEQGLLNPEVKFTDLASYIWWLETGTSLQRAVTDSPYIGTYNDIAYYLLYNGILGDRRPSSGNVLTHKVLNYLDDLHKHDGKRVIIGEAKRIGDPRLEALNIEFKQIPYALYGTQASKD